MVHPHNGVDMGTFLVGDVLNPRDSYCGGRCAEPQQGAGVSQAVCPASHMGYSGFFYWAMCALEECDELVTGCACNMQKNNNVYEENISFFIYIYRFYFN